MKALVSIITVLFSFDWTILLLPASDSTHGGEELFEFWGLWEWILIVLWLACISDVPMQPWLFICSSNIHDLVLNCILLSYIVFTLSWNCPWYLPSIDPKRLKFCILWVDNMMRLHHQISISVRICRVILISTCLSALDSATPVLFSDQLYSISEDSLLSSPCCWLKHAQ